MLQLSSGGFMKVILIEDVKKTGKKDEILNVKDGYGRYLITNNLAVLYTPKSKDILNKEQQEKQRQEDNAIKLASETKKKIENIKCSFIVKTGKQDKVFGSISNKQISEELKKHNINIDKKKIKIINEINTLGVHNVEIELNKKVKATLQVVLEGEK